MPDQIPSDTEVEIIEGAISLIMDQKAALLEATEALAGLPEQNAELRALITKLEDEDTKSDNALAKLRDLLPGGPAVPAEPEPAPPVPEDPDA